MWFARAASILLMLAAGSLPLSAQGERATPPNWRADSVAVSVAVSHFLTAFERLDWEPFRISFADSATVFFPTPEPPERFVGRAAIEAQFRKVFAAIRQAVPAGPPYQRLTPEDLRVERLDADAVLVSFLLRNSERIARRTLIFKRYGREWRIQHLHASNVPVAR